MINRNRKCYKCETEFVLKENQKASNICTKCKTTYQREYARRKVEESDDHYKDKYPYPENEKLKRFRNTKLKLSNMQNREEWQIFFKDKLDYMEENEPDLLVWIFDRRDQNSIGEQRDRKPKKQNSYEDTRSTKNNNKSWFD